jgi:Transcription factor WhiB
MLFAGGTPVTAVPLDAWWLDDDDDWTARAACRGAPVGEFFPDDGEGLARAAVRLGRSARRYCAWCPVLRECAQWADRGSEVGLYAGVYRSSVGAHRVLLPSAREPRWQGPAGRSRVTP